MSSSEHSYPPSVPGSAPSQGINPQLIAHFDGILQARLAEMEQGYLRELSGREAAWKEQELSMKAEIQELNKKFADANIQQRYQYVKLSLFLI
jgi:hypothetical protein